MRFLLVSERFGPSVGGVETVTRLVGGALVGAGHEVTLVTNERGGEEENQRFRLLRRPGVLRLLRAYHGVDAVILQGPTLRLGWPLLWRQQRAVMVHHIAPRTCGNGLSVWLRERLAGRARHASVSAALARIIQWPVEGVLPNPYDETVFQVDKAVARELDVAFIGRLVAEKGAQVLVEALAILQRKGIALGSSIVGDGPELKRLRKEIAAKGLEKGVALQGQVIGSELARLLNRHRVLVVPSLCPEGFGLVALEAIACGCIVIGSNVGGLPEAIGPCGATFQTGNAESLADTLRNVLGSADKMQRLRARAEEHLAKHLPGIVAKKYLEFIDEHGGRSLVSGEKQRQAEPVECVSS